MCRSSEVQLFRRLHSFEDGATERHHVSPVWSLWMHVPLENVFHNHLRDVHGIPNKKSKRTSLGTMNKALLETYNHNVSKRLTLEEIENVSEFLDIKQETANWWFVNRNKQTKA